MFNMVCNAMLAIPTQTHIHIHIHTTSYLHDSQVFANSLVHLTLSGKMLKMAKHTFKKCKVCLDILNVFKYLHQ